MGKGKITFTVLLLAFLILANVKPAQGFGDWYVFGDSLSDNGNIPKLTGYPFPPSPYYGNRFSNGPVWAEFFPTMSNFSFKPSNDFAVGGAFTGPISAQGPNGQPGTFNNLENTAWGPSISSQLPQLPSFLTEIQQFAASGGRFKSSDLAGVWIGANNFFATANQAAALQQSIVNNDPSYALNSGISPALLNQIASVYAQTGDPNKAMGVLIDNAAQHSVSQVAQGITQMYALGAKQIVVLTLPPIQNTPSALQEGAQAQALATGYTRLYNTYLQQSLSSIHNQTGLNIITLNGEVLFNEIVSNKEAYGIVNTTDEAIQHLTDPNYSHYLFWDGVHPTSYTQSIIAQYVSSAVKTFYSLTVPARLIEINSDAFNSLINNRIDSVSQSITKSNKTNGGPNLYITGNYNSGSRDDSDSTIGFDYDIGTTALGADYWITPDLLIGASVGYGHNHASLNDSAGKVNADVYQFALYSLYKFNNFFLNAQFDYGYADFTKISHPGVISKISNSSAEGHYVNFSANGGYVFKLDKFSIIPNAGIRGTNTRINAYDLTGDPGLNMSVDKQSLFSLFSTVGLKANYEAKLGTVTMVPNISLEMQSRLNGSGGKFNSYFQDEPSILLTSKYPDYYTNWGVVKIGLDAFTSDRLSVSINYSNTFEKSNSEDRSVWAQISYKF